MTKEIVCISKEEDQIYIHVQAARMARVSLNFLMECDRAGLIRAVRKKEGLEGYRLGEIEKVQLIRRLHEDLALDLETIDLVIHMRKQILDLLRRNEELKALLRSRIK
jgi:hypothetical protein